MTRAEKFRCSLAWNEKFSLLAQGEGLPQKKNEMEKAEASSATLGSCILSKNAHSFLVMLLVRLPLPFPRFIRCSFLQALSRFSSPFEGSILLCSDELGIRSCKIFLLVQKMNEQKSTFASSLSRCFAWKDSLHHYHHYNSTMLTTVVLGSPFPI